MSPPPSGDSGPPYPDPVQFDYALADAAMGSLRTAIQQLQQLTPPDVESGNRALQNWLGPHADRFRPEFAQMQRTAGQLIQDMQTWLAAINTAYQNASATQAQQSRANQQWYIDHGYSRPMHGPF